MLIPLLAHVEGFVERDVRVSGWLVTHAVPYHLQVVLVLCDLHLQPVGKPSDETHVGFQDMRRCIGQGPQDSESLLNRPGIISPLQTERPGSEFMPDQVLDLGASRTAAGSSKGSTKLSTVPFSFILAQKVAVKLSLLDPAMSEYGDHLHTWSMYELIADCRPCDSAIRVFASSSCVRRALASMLTARVFLLLRTL